MVDLSTNLCGISLTNPLIGASGTFGYGLDMSEIFDIDTLGSFSFKGTTLNPRFGNEGVRIAEGKDGIINSVGLENPGVDGVIKDVLPRLRKIYHKPFMANVSGFSIDEYTETVRRLNSEEGIGWFEINISCPNVHGGGMSFGTDPKEAAKVTAAVRKCTDKPIIMKLTPNVTDIKTIAKACEEAGADGLALVNTFLAMRIDINKARPILDNITGGLSGNAIFPIALRMVYEVYEAVNIPIVGIGGISKASDVIEMLMAGAVATEIGAALLKNPLIAIEILTELPKLMESLGYKNISEIIGIAHK